MDELISYIEPKYEHSSKTSYAHKTGSMYEIYFFGNVELGLEISV